MRKPDLRTTAELEAERAESGISTDGGCAFERPRAKSAEGAEAVAAAAADETGAGTKEIPAQLAARTIGWIRHSRGLSVRLVARLEEGAPEEALYKFARASEYALAYAKHVAMTVDKEPSSLGNDHPRHARIEAFLATSAPADEARLREAFAKEFGKSLVSLEFAEPPLTNEGFPPAVDLDGTEKRCVILSDQDFKCLLDGMYSTFGTGAQLVLWHLGKSMATRCTASSMDYIEDPLALAKFCFEKRQMLGLGMFEVEAATEAPGNGATAAEGSKGAARGSLPFTVRVRNPIECASLASNVFLDKFPPALTKGYVEGTFEAAFLEKFSVEETKCIRKGDPYCEFEVRAARKAGTEAKGR